MATEKNAPRLPDGKEIENKMIERGWTQAELAVLSGVSQPTISNIINEKKTTCTNKMRKIIEVLWGS